MIGSETPNEVMAALLRRKEVEKEKEHGQIIDIEVAALEEVHVQVKGQKKKDKDKKGRKLRRCLRLYLYAAAKWRDCNCYFNLIFFIVAVIQIIKTALLTKQMLEFGDQRAHFQGLVDRGKTTLSHLLLSSWESSMEVPPYPPNSGKYAVYTINDLTKHINFAVEKYYSSPNDAIGIYMLNGSKECVEGAVIFCVNYFTYDNVKMDVSKHKAEMYDVCFKSHPNLLDNGNCSYDIVADMKINHLNETLIFNSFLKINLTFHLFSLRLDISSGSGRCLSIHGIISFTNKDDNGQALVELQTDTGEVSCKDIGVDLPDIETIIESNYAVIVMIFASISMVFMVLDFAAGIYLYHKTNKYMKQNSEKHFPGQQNGISFKEYACHIKGWNLVVMIGDFCTFIGTIGAYTMDVKWRLYRLDENAIWLGLGCLLCWISLARYIHFNKKFHLLFRTMYHAFPDVLAYLFCVGLLFIGFTLCGYVVFGPYHNKFQTMSNAADTLFSTISGDEITITLAAIETDKLGSQAVWWFAKTYLWMFISIFTVFILNILIAIFNSAYETIQKEYEEKKKNTDPLRRVLRELLYTDDNLQGSIGQVKNGLHEILNCENNTDMSPREYDLRQELKAVVMDNDTSRKPTIKEFMESGGERLNKHFSHWRVHCIIPKEDVEV
ncbi:hypothetical protein CHS0354_037079 [Potamilus streckersoni]|uniref:Polycystin cation channel PKD1/PKD2 domain-containing protein n=1 Tax=Potamilus streckersoni TaxID=2493646 RepID=A0AAE0SQN5_9BIVA|nr:hypothetical protein CHS0354_037079 [Potamilus streckersoni]